MRLNISVSGVPVWDVCESYLYDRFSQNLSRQGAFLKGKAGIERFSAKGGIQGTNHFLQCQ